MTSVSVIIPIYNAELHLDECLKSLKQQTIQNIEFLMIDDGSTDNSKNICKKYLKDKRFKYFYKNNGGQVSAYLKGFKNSVGNYICFVDADDYVDKNMFIKMYNKATDYNADIVICKRVNISQNGSLISYEKSFLDEGLYENSDIQSIYKLTFPPFNGRHMHNSRWNKMFKRSIFEKNVKYCCDKVRTLEDRFIVPACIFSSSKIYILNKCLYFYRQGINTSHSKARVELYDILKKLGKRQKEMLIENSLYSQYKTQYEIAQLNYISLFVDRNIIHHGSFKDKLFYSRQIISDNEYRNLIIKYKSELNGKKGILLKFCYYLKIPLFLSILSYLGKNRVKRVK